SWPRSRRWRSGWPRSPSTRRSRPRSTKGCWSSARTSTSCSLPKTRKRACALSSRSERPRSKDGDVDVTQAVEQVVLVEVRERVGWIRLNRPDRMNAVNGDLRRQLLAALKQVEKDDAVRCVVVIGSGRAFCAGADVGEFGTREGSLEAIRDEYHGILTRLRSMPKPVIAAMNGVAAGIGAS